MGMRKRALAFAFCLTVVASSARAAGQLMVHPSRVVFRGTERAARIDVTNNGSETATYRISFVRKRMTEAGEFVTVDEPLPGERFADEMVRYSPRQVELPPGGSQVVRLQFRKPADLETGEYRSHLLLQALPPARRPGSGAAGTTTDLNIELTAVVSVSIPVIVRSGPVMARTSLSGLRLAEGSTPEAPSAAFEIRREGTRSVYGDVIAYFTPHGGKELVVGRANGVAVYVPNPLRKAVLPLRMPKGTTLRGGRLRVEFRERDAEKGDGAANAQLDLP